jgi:TonB family protein
MALSTLTYEVPRARRWNTFVAGLAIDLIGLLVLIAMGSRLGGQVLARPVASYHVTLIAPSIEPTPRPVPARIIPPSAQEIAQLETPRIVPTPTIRIEPPEPQKVEPPTSELRRPEPPKPELPKIGAFTQTAAAPVAAKQSQEVEVVKTNVFEAPKSAIATVHQPAREVQTGGFGDPHGISGQGDPKRQTIAVASVGSFDLPSGPAKGNGTGGTHGVSGTIRSTGFGDGVSSSVPRERNAGSVMASGFGDMVARSGEPASQRTEKKPDLQPVEIVYKPRPQYTPEARQLRLEGEVLLEVVFTASGSLHINRVVKGLGHGLDDSALAAAQRIQFRPARRDGQPYDCAALVHMVFELAE